MKKKPASLGHPIDRPAGTKHSLRRARGPTAAVTHTESEKYVDVYAKRRGMSNADSIAQEILDSMDPTKQSGAGVVLKEGREAAEGEGGVTRVKYLRVIRRTDKAIYVSFGTVRRWLPKDLVTFLEGCWLEMPLWMALKKTLITESSKR